LLFPYDPVPSMPRYAGNLQSTFCHNIDEFVLFRLLTCYIELIRYLYPLKLKKWRVI
jgi:hypothetical protein